MIVQLDDRSLLKLSGGDAQSFLQGQFSNDIDALKEGVAQLNTYCQHQGKIIALLWVMKKDGDFYLSFPSDLKEVVVQKLTMFKMMSDVQIDDMSDQMIQLGIVDQVFDGAYWLNDHQSIALVESIDNLDLSDSDQWEMACVQNNIAEVVLETSEKFVPQLLNLDIDELGVSFTKGCYPGQEVVARLHYLGKSKRQMREFVCNEVLKVGDELIVADSKSTKASGVVVRQVKYNQKFYCLATIETAHENSRITLNSSDGAVLTLIND